MARSCAIAWVATGHVRPVACRKASCSRYRSSVIGPDSVLAAEESTWQQFVETYLSGTEADYQAAVRRFAEQQEAK